MKLETVFRQINKNRKYFITNAIGLSFALISIILIFSFISKELNYDKFHSKSDRIYRITQNTNTGISSMVDARYFTGTFQQLKTNFPQIEQITGLSYFRKSIVTIDDKVFYSEKAFRADSSFFNVFDFELVVGDKNNLFNIPRQAAITESMAKIYFGTTDVVGKQIKIMHQRKDVAEEYTIKGVLKDFPENAHFKADILCSYNPKEYNYWAYSYILLAPHTNYLEIQKLIQEEWDVKNKDSDNRPLVDLQPLTDIHLYSHKTRELEQNGNIATLILLFSGAFAIVIIALINFFNLNYVQFLSEQKNRNIRIINGATRLDLAKLFLREVFILLSFTVLLSILLSYYLSNLVNLNLFLFSSRIELGLLILGFAFLVIVLAYIPYVYQKNISNANVALSNKSYQASLLVQLILSIIAIVSTLFLQKQINYFNFLHPQSESAHIIVIPNNVSPATAKFEVLKEQLLKYPEIISACAVSEEPAGTVVDNFGYTYDGDTTANDKTLNILAVDNDFFTFMDIKPIAGTVDLGSIPTYGWEQKAIQLWRSEVDNQELPEGFDKEEIQSYSEKYIINKTALKHMGIKNAEDAIGKEFRINQYMSYLFPKGNIIGVVDDFHYSNIYEKEKPLAIMPRKLFCHNFLFRIDSNNKAAAISIIKSKWQEINRGIPFKYEFITDSYRKVYQKEYNQMKVIMLFALFSILLSVIGIYAMVSFNLKMKTKEIGIRKVNGATVFEIMKMLSKDFVKWGAIAFVIAVPISYIAMQKWLENFAYKTALSWWVFALAGIITMTIVLITVSWHTYRVARKNPVETLRYE